MAFAKDAYEQNLAKSEKNRLLQSYTTTFRIKYKEDAVQAVRNKIREEVRQEILQQRNDDYKNAIYDDLIKELTSQIRKELKDNY